MQYVGRHPHLQKEPHTVLWVEHALIYKCLLLIAEHPNLQPYCPLEMSFRADTKQWSIWPLSVLNSFHFKNNSKERVLQVLSSSSCFIELIKKPNLKVQDPVLTPETVTHPLSKPGALSSSLPHLFPCSSSSVPLQKWPAIIFVGPGIWD